MGEAIITRRDCKKLSPTSFAAIHVMYPQGYSCICTNGVKIMTARDSSGQCIFMIPEEGSWTVTATDGTTPKSKVVNITGEGQKEDVQLNDPITLFNNGDNTAVTGGWDCITGMAIDTFNTTSSTFTIKVSGSSKNGNYAFFPHTINKIDVTNFSNIEINITQLTNVSAVSWDIGLIKELPGFSDLVNALNPLQLNAYIAPTTTGTFNLDVSNLSGSYYFCMYTAFVGAYGRSGTLAINKIIVS